MSKLKAMQSSQDAHGINHESNERREKESLTREEKDELISFQRAQLASLKTKLEVLQKEHSTSVTYVRVAGSGKSTLMKYLSENKRTLSRLKQWAGTSDLYVASYYFWNQGNEMQKSRIGLMQSLLYQVLRSAPQLIPSVCRERLQHEAWELNELIATFERIAKDTKLLSKFCFFIDGLDEYDGDEHEVLPMLEILSACPHIKVCVSSRPGRIYEQPLRNDQRAFDIAKFTREDMQQYVFNQLTSSEKFQTLAAQEPGCQELIADISQYADGVWLWVFLVTRDIVHEVDRDEPLSTLRKIVDEFPADLEKYFQRIIGRIKDIHKEEMARTFLVTTHELQPLPLYAFALLNRERLDPDYALSASIQADPDEILRDHSQYALWRNRVQNRCGDLLVMVGSREESPLSPVLSSHREVLPVLLTDSVDFLHRTVRDFLRDSFHNELQRHLKSDYNPLLSLCRISLSLVKAVPVNNIRNHASANRMIALTDELLYYAYEVERMGIAEHTKALVPLLKELDRVNSYYGRRVSNHWTHVRDSPPAQGLDEYREGGKCNFLALAIQARLVNFVSSELEADPQLIRKQGRPLLDYALRPRRMTPISMPYHSDRYDPSVNVDMVEMLISHGADPNEAVYAYDDESVWKLFLISIFETTERASVRSIPENLKTAWYKAAEALVKAGAQSDRNGAFVRKEVADKLGGTDFVLDSVFGAPAARKLRDIIEMRAQERDEERRGRCAVM
ncbi:hypothetical protein FB567DRAFT_445409 [Paraphoma chrysanthemicola]|uniref:NACHT domain-containing protein n=1 Tax=Paraphoma chrysanthemicola TaxID=798071 RepID=A0A8K0R302_9PLEO|nr:hypothetical protein FB567DRAFT_445409 [Paraphoma chrysanthemicola]